LKKDLKKRIMPVMDGHEALKSIREFRPDLPVIRQIAFTMETDPLLARKMDLGVR
jgi:CheY-like chemotaxis protein